MAEKKKKNYDVPEALGRRLFHATVNALISKIESGEATPSDLATAARICKENGIEIGVDPLEGDGLTGVLQDDLPNFGDE